MVDLRPIVAELVRGFTTAGEEAQVLDLLASAGRDDLCHLLADAPLTDHVLRDVDNHGGGRDYYDRLLRLLTVDRIGELDLAARASVVRALQTGVTAGREERAVRDVLLATRGRDLTELKNLLNTTDDDHDLERLVFGDIGDKQVRAEILAHIATEAAGVHIDEAKVLSDIDDTAVCRLKDRRFPKGTFYPGVLAFWDALDQGPHHPAASIGDLTFVTARPSDAFGIIENHTRAVLRKAGVAQKTVITGSIFALLSNSDIAEKKLDNITHYNALFPEYHIVFMGDSGQGDVLVGDALYQHFPEAVRAVFIHDVVNTPAAERERYREERIYFFDTYPAAAAKAYELGLIDEAGLREVMAEASAGFDKVRWDSAEQETAVRELLAVDLAAAEAALAG